MEATDDKAPGPPLPKMPREHASRWLSSLPLPEVLDAMSECEHPVQLKAPTLLGDIRWHCQNQACGAIL